MTDQTTSSANNNLHEAQAEIKRLKEENAALHKKFGYPDFRTFLGMPPANLTPRKAEGDIVETEEQINALPTFSVIAPIDGGDLDLSAKSGIGDDWLMVGEEKIFLPDQLLSRYPKWRIIRIGGGA